jgi:hypothetical protein
MAEVDKPPEKSPIQFVVTPSFSETLITFVAWLLLSLKGLTVSVAAFVGIWVLFIPVLFTAFFIEVKIENDKLYIGLWLAKKIGVKPKEIDLNDFFDFTVGMNVSATAVSDLTIFWATLVPFRNFRIFNSTGYKVTLSTKGMLMLFPYVKGYLTKPFETPNILKDTTDNSLRKQLEYYHGKSGSAAQNNFWIKFLKKKKLI